MSTLIGLGGKLRAGKDEVAKYLAEQHDYITMGMSDALNEALLALNPIILVHTPIEPHWNAGEYARYRDLHDAVGYVEAKRNPEVRRLLQALGTEVGRNMIGQDVWVDIAERRIRAELDAGHNVVITAVRFPNELEMLERLGGMSVWIERADEAREADESVSSHASETSVSAELFDCTIFNNRGIPELHEAVEGLLAFAEDIEIAQLVREHIRIAIDVDESGPWPDYDR
jgi:hypothetical protein